MLWPAVINALPLLVPSACFSRGIAGPAFHSQLAYIAPVLQLLALYVSSLDGFEKVIDPAGLSFAFGFVLRFVLLAMRLSGVKCVHKSRKELTAGVLKYEHGHNGWYLFGVSLIVVEMGTYAPVQRGSATLRLRLQ